MSYMTSMTSYFPYIITTFCDHRPSTVDDIIPTVGVYRCMHTIAMERRIMSDKVTKKKFSVGSLARSCAHYVALICVGVSV